MAGESHLSKAYSVRGVFVGEGLNETELLEQWLREGGKATLDRFTQCASDVVGVMDRQCIIRYVNWAAPGLTRENVVGQSAFAFIPQRDAKAAHDAFDRTLSKGLPAHFEITYENELAPIVFVVRVNPIVHEGRVLGAFTLNTDATEERRGTLDKDRFFSLSLDMLAVVTPEGILRRLNPAFGEALGYGLDDLMEKPFIDFVHPDDVERTQEAYRAVQDGVVIDNFENRYRRRDGTYRVFSWRAKVDPITRDVYAVARDFTDHRTTEAQLRHAQKMEAVGQLAGGIAHDFNNLMQAVLANVEAALIPESSEQDVISHLREIEGAGQRAAELTKQLLVFSRQQHLDRAPLNLNSLILGLMKLLGRLLPENIAIQLRSGDNLPSVNADHGQLEQVVINLCVNARDAMEAGGKLTIETGDTVFGGGDCVVRPGIKPGHFVYLRVTDSGIGMDPAIRERIFEPFFTTKSHRKGTGLGLSTLYGIVQQHGGMVDVESEAGRGSAFTIFLPVDGRPVTGRSAANQPAETPRGSETVLLVEDEEVVRKPLLSVLKKAGYQTLSARNGREAIELLDRYKGTVDLVLLDLVMPELSGPDAWQKMTEINPNLAVLFMSGYADAHYRERLPSHAEVLDKPFPTEELLRRIRARLDL